MLGSVLTQKLCVLACCLSLEVETYGFVVYVVSVCWIGPGVVRAMMSILSGLAGPDCLHGPWVVRVMVSMVSHLAGPDRLHCLWVVQAMVFTLCHLAGAASLQ